VRLDAVAPVFTLTDLTEDVGRDEQSLAPFVNRIALGRPGRPEDVALPVLFLASHAARHVTGVVLPVDGGTSASTGQPHVEVRPERLCRRPDPGPPKQASGFVHRRAVRPFPGCNAAGQAMTGVGGR
jgi:hypothetical protein